MVVMRAGGRSSGEREALLALVELVGEEMEVDWRGRRWLAPVDTTTTAESQQQQEEDPPMNSRFTWVIEHFSRLHPKKHYSDIFMVGGYKWRVLIFPKGNNVDHLSMYLHVADSVNLPYGWSRYAQFSLAVVNQMHSKYSVRKGIIFAGIKVDFN
ncbi:uncharacterized protein A4U43_C09F6960 [Asparagus officinalis]|uniref:MATH domain-containing protein n=1 Tax=Asparagus officinalis TaxID=4686 RepID=A0A5P1E935_ASPOF|nr:uncharacterized protein A4U43_C09F6960 [Asparagus officinalis]